MYGRAVEHLLLGPCGLKAVRKENGELRFCHRPLPRRHFPLFLRSVQDQVEQFCRRLIARKMTSCPDGATQLGIRASMALVV